MQGPYLLSSPFHCHSLVLKPGADFCTSSESYRRGVEKELPLKCLERVCSCRLGWESRHGKTGDGTGLLEKNSISALLCNSSCIKADTRVPKPKVSFAYPCFINHKVFINHIWKMLVLLCGLWVRCPPPPFFLFFAKELAGNLGYNFSRWKVGWCSQSKESLGFWALAWMLSVKLQSMHKIFWEIK